MSGILDSKTRVLDTIITLEGRKQLAMGGINIHYVSFTDGATYYAADIQSGSADATARLYLESCHLPQDTVTFKADDLGRLLPFDAKGDKVVRGGQVIDYSFNAEKTTLTGSALIGTTLRGDTLNQVGTGILSGAIDNFVKQMAIGSRDPIFDDEGFALGRDNIEFTIHEDRPLTQASGHLANINHLEDIFADPRFSHLPNFKYMPPINKIEHSNVDKTDHRNVSGHHLGSYVPWGRSHSYKIDHYSVVREHSHYAAQGFMKVINFEPTSRANNLFIQAFEMTNDTMFKLDIIDFGTWYSPPTEHSVLVSPDDPGPVCQIFFVGKLMTKPDTGTHTFIHLFTLLFG